MENKSRSYDNTNLQMKNRRNQKEGVDRHNKEKRKEKPNDKETINQINPEENMMMGVVAH